MTEQQETQGIAVTLYFATKAIHHEAETTGVIRHLLRGNASREGYVMLMRNVLPAYRALEQGLAQHRANPALFELAGFAFDRAGATEADLHALCGGDFASISLLSEGEAYAARIAEVSQGDPTRLIAHAYTRYLGDLSGGQILRRLLKKSLDLQENELSFYDFPRFPDLTALKTEYRNAIDRAGALANDKEAIVAEAMRAFQLNIDVSCAVDAHLAGRAAAE
jgi:heme oxygenase